MEQVARGACESNAGFLAIRTHHARQSAIGLPFYLENYMMGRMYRSQYTMSEIIRLDHYNSQIEQSEFMRGILFLDEINCNVSEDL